MFTVRKGTDGKKDVVWYLHRVYNLDKLHTCAKPQTADVMDDVFVKLLDDLAVNASSHYIRYFMHVINPSGVNVVDGENVVATLLYSKLPSSPCLNHDFS